MLNLHPEGEEDTGSHWHVERAPSAAETENVYASPPRSARGRATSQSELASVAKSDAPVCAINSLTLFASHTESLAMCIVAIDVAGTRGGAEDATKIFRQQPDA